MDWKKHRAELEAREPAKRRVARKEFVVDFVKVPNHWIDQLARARHLATPKLAHHVLREAYKQSQSLYGGEEIVLSAKATGLPHTTRSEASKELVGLGLIQTQQTGNQATRIIGLAAVEWWPRRKRP